MSKRKTTRPRKRVTRRKPSRRKAKPKLPIKQWLIALLSITAVIAGYYWLIVRPAKLNLPAGRAIATSAELQIALARQGCSPGSIDGTPGSQTKLALKAFQSKHGLPLSGELDPATSRLLRIEDPVFAVLELSERDFARVSPKPKTWREREFIDSMAYNSILEMVAEHSLSDPDYIKALNPSTTWNSLRAGARIRVPYVKRFTIPSERAHSIQIHLSLRQLQLLDAEGQLLFHCPVSIARNVDKR
ncbi:MAG: peptidoglycan-binding domain-containing protein, partial [Coraliomargarita sp.]